MSQSREYGRAQYAKHREKRLAAKRAEREADPEKSRAYVRAMYAKHREKRIEWAREYRRQRKEQLAAQAREKYAKNRDEINARRREQSKRPEARQKHYAYIRAWFARNPGKRLLMQAKALIWEQTGIPIRDIPKELAEAKAEQLKITRLVREMQEASK